MPWEKRERGGLYYTRSRKTEGRVVREYIGTGPAAEEAARQDELARAERRAAAEGVRLEREHLAEMDKPLDQLCELADVLARAVLMAAGYHQHNRGEWRRRRKMTEIEKPKSQTQDLSTDECTELIRRARMGDEEAFAVLRDGAANNTVLWEAAGDIVGRIENAWIRAVAGSNKVTGEGIRRKLAAVKEELSGPQCSPLERLLVDRVAACWLQVMHADAADASCLDPNAKRLPGASDPKRQDRAHRRFLSAVKMLATIRKMELPALQVNIADQQVNVAG